MNKKEKKYLKGLQAIELSQKTEKDIYLNKCKNCKYKEIIKNIGATFCLCTREKTIEKAYKAYEKGPCDFYENNNEQT